MNPATSEAATPHASSSTGPPVLAHVLFADCRAPGPTTASIGWKVKEVCVAPGSGDVDRDLLVAVDSVGQAYAPDLELAAVGRSAEAPTTFKQLRLRDDVMLTATFADAGLDRTGRASHVVHGLIRSGPLVAEDGRSRRPVELLDSSTWLRPIGEREVEAATVSGLPFALPAGPVDPDAMTGDAFLTDLDHAERIELLPVVLEAFRRSLDDDAALLLLVPDRAEIVGWLALLQSLLDPVSAGRLRFSTREEVRSASAFERWDLQVAGLLVRSAAPAGSGTDTRLAALGPRFLVVDTTRPPVLTADGNWALSETSVLTRSPWTDVAESVLSSPTTAVAVRRELDALAGVAPATVSARPSWALAVAAIAVGADTLDRASLLRFVFQDWPAVDEVAAELGARIDTVLADELARDATLLGDLATRLGDGVPPALADLVVDGWVRQELADPGGANVLSPPRPLSPAVAGALAPDLPALVTWLADVPAHGRVPALVRVWALATGVGVADTDLAVALTPHARPVADVLVDPGFDPVAAGWPSLPPPLWRWVLGDAVSDALAPGGATVSAAVHRWLEPSLADPDRPGRAVANQVFTLTPYGWQRAAWEAAAGDDPWLTGLAAIGRIDALARRLGWPLARAASAVLGDVYATRTLPVDVATVMLRGVSDRDPDMLIAITAVALAHSEFDGEHVALAQAVWDRLQAAGHDERPDTELLYLHLMVRPLVAGDPAAAASQAVVPAAEHVLEIIYPRLPAGRLRQRVGLLLAAWGLRLPVSMLQDARLATGFRWLAGDLDVVEAAFVEVVRRNQLDDVRRVLANLIVRTGLVWFPRRYSERNEPFLAYLTRTSDRDDGVFLRDHVASWLSEQDVSELERLRSAVDDVIDDLVSRGWDADRAELEHDRDDLFAMLSSRSLLGRRRQGR